MPLAGVGTLSVTSMGNISYKTCPGCKKVKLYGEFHKGKGPHGLSYKCKDCLNSYNYAWRAANPEAVKRHRRTNRLKVRGLVQEEFRRLFDRQGGGCAICGATMTDPQIDHDHETGAVRGLLCRHCNLGLGHFRDDGEVLEKAISYLLTNGPLPRHDTDFDTDFVTI